MLLPKQLWIPDCCLPQGWEQTKPIPGLKIIKDDYGYLATVELGHHFSPCTPKTEYAAITCISVAIGEMFEMLLEEKKDYPDNEMPQLDELLEYFDRVDEED